MILSSPRPRPWPLASALAILLLAGCDNAAAPDDAAAQSPAPAIDTANLPHALLLGDWAPDAATCGRGEVLTVGAATLGGAALGVADCRIEASTREGDIVTVLATCTAEGFAPVTITLEGGVLGQTPPAMLTMLQTGPNVDAAAREPIDVTRCAAP